MRSKLFLSLLGVMTVVLFSCRKDVIKNENNEQLISKVNNWLDSRKPSGKAKQSENVDLLKNHLETSALGIENSFEGEKLVIIPVNEELKTLKHIDREAIPNLVLILDKIGNIRKGNIVLFYPQNKQTSKVPVNTFYDIMNTAKSESNGKFKYLSVTGKQCYELQYENGHLKSFGHLKDSVPNNTARTNDFCINWYWHYTFYDEFGMVYYEYDEYIGTTCQGEDCFDPYNAMLCPLDGGSGGGTGDDQAYEYAMSRQWKWQVGKEGNDYTIESYETVTGVKVGYEPQGGHFTTIVHVNSYFEVANADYSWQQLGNTVSVDNPRLVYSFTKGKAIHDPSGYSRTWEKPSTRSFSVAFP